MKEQRIRELSKFIEDTLNTLAEPSRELFEDIYEGKCEDEHKSFLSKLVLIVQEDLPIAEMKYKKVGM